MSRNARIRLISQQLNEKRKVTAEEYFNGNFDWLIDILVISKCKMVGQIDINVESLLVNSYF